MGSWERLIQSAKLVMRVVLNQRVVTPEVLFTVMTGVEALLYARQLTPVSSNLMEADALTPNHFCTDVQTSSFMQIFRLNRNA